MSRSNEPLKYDRPSLCSYCTSPSGGLLLRVEDRYYGSCCMEHTKKIRERLERGEPLPYVAQLNYEGIKYALTLTKDTYLEIAKKENTFVMHEWERDQRMKLFGKAIAEYLNYCSELADKGLLVKELRENG